MAGLVTLTTDFGEGSPYVAAMKGVLLSRNPALTIINLTHTIRPQNVRHGAIVLADTYRYFPAGTIHVVVVDPDVGTDRAILAVEVDSHYFILPDNGLLSLILREKEPTAVVKLTACNLWRESVSTTFHGRDIMAPVAAQLSSGVALGDLGTPVENLRDIVQLELPAPVVAPGLIEGEVLLIDHFGNLITNILATDLVVAGKGEKPTTVGCGEFSTGEFVSAYGERPVTTCVALVGSTGRLELAVVRGNAAQQYNAQVGDSVVVRWPESMPSPD